MIAAKSNLKAKRNTFHVLLKLISSVIYKTALESLPAKHFNLKGYNYCLRSSNNFQPKSTNKTCVKGGYERKLNLFTYFYKLLLSVCTFLLFNKNYYFDHYYLTRIIYLMLHNLVELIQKLFLSFLSAIFKGFFFNIRVISFYFFLL